MYFLTCIKKLCVAQGKTVLSDGVWMSIFLHKYKNLKSIPFFLSYICQMLFRTYILNLPSNLIKSLSLWNYSNLDESKYVRSVVVLLLPGGPIFLSFVEKLFFTNFFLPRRQFRGSLHFPKLRQVTSSLNFFLKSIL